jgi:hypothetical protein
MADESSSTTAKGEIENAFILPERGWALVIKNGFRGNIHKNGIVKGRHGAAAYIGPEFIDSDIQGESWVAVIVAIQFKDLFTPGEEVTFYDRH